MTSDRFCGNWPEGSTALEKLWLVFFSLGIFIANDDIFFFIVFPLCGGFGFDHFLDLSCIATLYNWNCYLPASALGFIIHREEEEERRAR